MPMMHSGSGRPLQRGWLCWGTVFMLFIVAGCSGDNPLGRRAVRGTVTLKGQPVQSGSIQFSPVDEQQGVASGAVISAGTFEIPEAKGLPPGKYKVIVSSAQSAGSAAPSDQPPGPPGQLAVEMIPPDWNVDPKHTIDISADGDNELKLDIK